MTRKLLVVSLVLACAIFVSQWVSIRKLRAEGEQIRAELAQGKASGADHEQTKELTQAEEGRLRAEQSELNRLRAEVSQLRKDIKAAQLAATKRAREAATTNSPVKPVSPVQSYSASVRANVPFNQTLVTGGWKLPSGKHALFFVEPQLMDRVGNVAQPGTGADQVVLQTHIVEVSEQALAKLGLDSLKSDAMETAAQLTLDETQAQTILDGLRQTEGADVLGAPRLLMLSGRQGQVKIANTFIGPTGEPFETGPMVDVVPTIAADGRSADLQLNAQMRLRR